MANLGLVSPGVLIREVDLTVGGITAEIDNVGIIGMPAQKGPIGEIFEVRNENDLINYFGTPRSNNLEYEYWFTASSFLAYGGRLKIIRCDDRDLRNANIAVGIATTTVGSGTTTSTFVGTYTTTGRLRSTLKIKNDRDYIDNFSENTTFSYAARNPGVWANNLKVCVIDNAADQILSVGAAATAAVAVGYAVTQAFPADAIIPGVGTTSSLDGYLQGIITGIGLSTIDVKITNRVSTAGSIFPVSYNPALDSYYNFRVGSATDVEFGPDATPGTGLAILDSNSTNANPSAGLVTAVSIAQNEIQDWYAEQQLDLVNLDINWKRIARKPGTSRFSSRRSSRNDVMHVLVVDDNGRVTGTPGTIIEKYLNLSKASDSGNAYYKRRLNNRSRYLFVGGTAEGKSSNFEGTLNTTLVDSPEFDEIGGLQFTPTDTSQNIPQQLTQGITFNVFGNTNYSLTGGVDYGKQVDLGGIIEAYQTLSDNNDETVDFIIGGPGLGSSITSAAKANFLISLAETRKDCMVTISPTKQAVLGTADANKQTENVIGFFDTVDPSSYAVFDSGWKYMYDRFNDTFRWVPCNGDIAGIMVRSADQSYPWYSPAGAQRGQLQNLVKLAYNPNQSQRDDLYTNRINPVIFSPGQGTILFGDKTALDFVSAFDRINVRRLFLTVESQIEKFSRTILFEFNDEITRANFRNVVEPYLRDIQAKRGIIDFLVICDDTNNTPEVIDANEFRADIFIKPARSINFIGLTFVATRTGVSFEEVVGTV
jgi:hypothetical protein